MSDSVKLLTTAEPQSGMVKLAGAWWGFCIGLPSKFEGGCLFVVVDRLATRAYLAPVPPIVYLYDCCMFVYTRLITWNHGMECVYSLF